ncbi:hypothetical protein SAMN05519104_5089 [Rhizobiales bacterium GAS188]|nr:hypothetical protein SAMN05519104_5089 [Rhizobiales bacterium GAS188]
MNELQFEWDEDKAAANLIKHEVSFLTAAGIFDNETIERIDDREDYGEERLIALGRVDFEVYRVVYTWRSEWLIRIISAQRVSKNERKAYYCEVFDE